MNLSVVGPRAIVKPDKQPEMTSDGLLHIVHDRQRSTMAGIVVALGDGPQSRSGNTLPHVVAIGDHVVFSPDAGEELIFENDLLVVMCEEDILAVVE